MNRTTRNEASAAWQRPKTGEVEPTAESTYYHVLLVPVLHLMGALCRLDPTTACSYEDWLENYTLRGKKAADQDVELTLEEDAKPPIDLIGTVTVPAGFPEAIVVRLLERAAKDLLARRNALEKKDVWKRPKGETHDQEIPGTAQAY